MSVKKTIVISCAGRGTRLGINKTKALVEIDGKPIIIRQLEMLKDYEDIRIIVGYQKEMVIDTVKAFRDDVTFLENLDYENTGTGASFTIGIQNAEELVVSLDGDLLVHPEDLKKILESDKECVCGAIPYTEDPILMQTAEVDGKLCGVGFSKDKGEYEWTGLVQVRGKRLLPGVGHVCDMLVPILPMEMEFIRCKEVDTLPDLENAVKWVKNGYKEN